MTWNYRVTKTWHQVGEDRFEEFSIREVYYEGEQIKGWTLPVRLSADTATELAEDLALMMQAFVKPVLDLTGEEPVEIPDEELEEE